MLTDFNSRSEHMEEHTDLLAKLCVWNAKNSRDIIHLKVINCDHVYAVFTVQFSAIASTEPSLRCIELHNDMTAQRMDS